MLHNIGYGIRIAAKEIIHYLQELELGDKSNPSLDTNAGTTVTPSLPPMCFRHGFGTGVPEFRRPALARIPSAMDLCSVNEVLRRQFKEIDAFLWDTIPRNSSVCLIEETFAPKTIKTPKMAASPMISITMLLHRLWCHRAIYCTSAAYDLLLQLQSYDNRPS